MRYQITVNFNTDRLLTNAELDHLTGACLVQVDDPADYMGENKRASFTVSGATSWAVPLSDDAVALYRKVGK